MNKILPSEQKGTYGCQDQLLIKKILLETVAPAIETDYRKALDSVLHTCILKVLRIYKISPTIIHFLTNSVKE